MYLTQNQMFILDKNLARKRGFQVDVSEKPATDGVSTIVNVGDGAILWQREGMFTIHAEEAKNAPSPVRVGLLFFDRQETPIFVPDDWDRWEGVVSGFLGHDHSRYYGGAE